MQANVKIDVLNTRVQWRPGNSTTLPNLWLRDNCVCDECRVGQTGEKKFLITSVPAQLQPASATVEGETLVLTWPDGHVTRFSEQTIYALSETINQSIEHWNSGFRPHMVDYEAFLQSDETAVTALKQFLVTGALIIDEMPCVSGTVELLQPRLGRIRDMPFGRLHEVRVDPSGYNVAHTSLPLPPHNDFASSNWPPSIQALHMLVNECEGGETVIVDGWAVAEQLRADHPDMFEQLCLTPVPFRMFSDEEETYAVNPLIRLDSEDRIAHLRYSNQLMQTLNPLIPGLDLFYQAYHELSRRLTSEAARAAFRLESGQCLLVAGHRVLHARNAFSPTGERHLQDAYFEHDCVRNHLTVIERRLESQS